EELLDTNNMIETGIANACNLKLKGEAVYHYAWRYRLVFWECFLQTTPPLRFIKTSGGVPYTLFPMGIENANLYVEGYASHEASTFAPYLETEEEAQEHIASYTNEAHERFMCQITSHQRSDNFEKWMLAFKPAFLQTWRNIKEQECLKEEALLSKEREIYGELSHAQRSALVQQWTNEIPAEFQETNDTWELEWPHGTMYFTFGESLVSIRAFIDEGVKLEAQLAIRVRKAQLVIELINKAIAAKITVVHYDRKVVAAESSKHTGVTDLMFEDGHGANYTIAQATVSLLRSIPLSNLAVYPSPFAYNTPHTVSNISFPIESMILNARKERMRGVSHAGYSITQVTPTPHKTENGITLQTKMGMFEVSVHDAYLDYWVAYYLQSDHVPFITEVFRHIIHKIKMPLKWEERPIIDVFQGAGKNIILTTEVEEGSYPAFILTPEQAKQCCMLEIIKQAVMSQQP